MPSDDDLRRAREQEQGFGFVDLGKAKGPFPKVLPALVCRALRVLPEKVHGETLYLAMETYGDEATLAKVEAYTRLTVVPLHVDSAKLSLALLDLRDA